MPRRKQSTTAPAEELMKPEQAPEDHQPRGTRRTRQNSAEEPTIQGPRIQELSSEDGQPRGTRRRRQDSTDGKSQAKEAAHAKGVEARGAKARKLGSPIDFMAKPQTVPAKQPTDKSRQGSKTAKARLVIKRALHLVQVHDYTVLRDGVHQPMFDWNAEWRRVATTEEHLNQYVKLKDYLSYDEMMLASLLGTSGPSFFINTGPRDNRAELNPEVPHQERGIMVGLVGARFAAKGQMDHALMLPPVADGPSPRRRQDHRMSKVFQEFFGHEKDDKRFNIPLYRARMQLSIETLLLESDDRAAQAGTTAYVHLVGLGLGVWAYAGEKQRVWYVEVVIQCLKDLDLKHVSTLEIAWIDVPTSTARKCEATGKGVGIRVLFNKRSPCAKLDTKELLIRSWAWDSNTLPGNEYWSGILEDSDDPAATCHSTIAELHNPYVNPFAHRIKVLQDRRRLSI
ncbi:hypothetical protein LTR37_017415 [Vermiconidia calcicola]|uniref:Uncharacterized protein n=1 Tax=Vermiconidia calcicola TaxID=1690605 RepID=A0ACC3MK88_9PEZI|nr:hypothetical protein LTR37_017415 [Vermiconidia calcicola]